MTGYWHSVLESLEDEIIIIGRDMRVRWANSAARRQWGEAQRGSPVGLPCHIVNHGGVPCSEDRCHCPVQDVLADGQPAQAVHVHSGDNDSQRYVEVVASPVLNGSQAVTEVVEVVRDVTQRFGVQQALKRRNEELNALHRVTDAVGSSLELDEVLGTTLETTIEVTQMDAGAIYLQQEDELVLRAFLNLSPDAAMAARVLRLDDTACGQASARGWPLITQPHESPNSPRWEPLRRGGLHTLIHIPLQANQRAVGTLCLGKRKEHQFDEETITLLNTLGRQIGVAIERARLYQELGRKERMRQLLLRQVITAQEDERKRIARELHDEIMQSLTAMLYQVESFSQMSVTSEQTQLAGKLWTLAQNTLDDVHNLIYDLRPGMLDNLGLLPAVRWWIEQRLTPQGIHTHLTWNGEPLEEEAPLPPFDADQETAIFRVLQEAINNIAEHARAGQVSINFEREAGTVLITVEDDGVGFDLEEAIQLGDSKRGLGLLGMWERMELIGGSLIISSSPGGGTAINLQWPLQKEVAHE